MSKINWIPALIMQVAKVPLLIIGSTMVMGAEQSFDRGFVTTAAAIYFTGIAVAIAAAIFSAMLHYKCWKAVPNGYRSITPDKAVGFLFIPLFNIYWGFKSYGKLARGFKNYGDANNIKIGNAAGLGIGYAVAAAFYFLCFLFPFASILGSLIQGIMFFLYYKEMTKYANIALQNQNEIVS